MYRSISRFLGVTPLLVGVLLLNGCIGYRLGSMLPPDINTVYVPTFINETDEPFLEVAATRAAIQEIQRDGSLRIAGEEDADTILTVRLTHFHLQPLAYDRERRAAAEEYRMYVTAAIVLTRRTTGEVVVESPRVVGDTTFLLLGDLTSAKQGAFPDVSADLGRRIITRVVETW